MFYLQETIQSSSVISLKTLSQNVKLIKKEFIIKKMFTAYISIIIILDVTW